MKGDEEDALVKDFYVWFTKIKSLKKYLETILTVDKNYTENSVMLFVDTFFNETKGGALWTVTFWVF
jgi:hypothetical protein